MFFVFKIIKGLIGLIFKLILLPLVLVLTIVQCVCIVAAHLSALFFNLVGGIFIVRYILADEVGLGKTIEAGLIIKELKSRGLIRRILVVCPTGLVTQWSLEMQEKFGEKFHVILPEEYETIRKITDIILQGTDKFCFQKVQGKNQE